ncbi:MAG: hypothetical protein C4576_19820 [Desulfobacteraceae bacterium]|nr:MAG: hypothetical protein C4576_19820 [Desulfobacteraceae bacterium]
MSKRGSDSDTGRANGSTKSDQPRNLGGRPPGSKTIAGPSAVLEGLERFLKKASKQLCQHIDHKLATEYIRGVQVYPDLHKLACGELPAAADPEAVLKTGRRGAYEELLQETSVKEVSTSPSPNQEHDEGKSVEDHDNSPL